jgi:hypothetical protein
MKLPIQSKPVLRYVGDTGMATALTDAVIASGCSTWKKIGCSTALAACGGICAAPGVGWAVCFECFAALGASSCIDCL